MERVNCSIVSLVPISNIIRDRNLIRSLRSIVASVPPQTASPGHDDSISEAVVVGCEHTLEYFPGAWGWLDALACWGARVEASSPTKRWNVLRQYARNLVRGVICFEVGNPPSAVERINCSIVSLVPISNIICDRNLIRCLRSVVASIPSRTASPSHDDSIGEAISVRCEGTLDYFAGAGGRLIALARWRTLVEASSPTQRRNV